MGILPIPYPNILGLSFAGTVEAVGAGVDSFKPGDRVVSARTGNASGDSRFGSFQKYALALTASTFKVPDSVSLEAAVTPIVNLGTVVSALSIHLGLERPPISGPANPKQRKVLIYGGSSSVGGLATKYASAAGYEVTTTSSPNNRTFVESLGPKHIIDHTQTPEAIVQQLKEHGPYDAILDCIGLPPVTKIFYDYLGSIGGGRYYTTLPPFGPEIHQPENVERVFASYSLALNQPEHADLAQWLYKEYLPRGLESGLIIPTRPEIIPGGLEKVQHALDLMNQGRVSGRKLILYP
jgi:NADPH:quinone reductase-like Zn-dependent oxidoreductase